MASHGRRVSGRLFLLILNEEKWGLLETSVLTRFIFTIFSRIKPLLCFNAQASANLNEDVFPLIPSPHYIMCFLCARHASLFSLL
jgi:hypothetical protein